MAKNIIQKGDEFLQNIVKVQPETKVNPSVKVHFPANDVSSIGGVTQSTITEVLNGETDSTNFQSPEPSRVPSDDSGMENGISGKTNVIHIKQDDIIHIGIPNYLTNGIDGADAIRYNVSNIDEIISAALYFEFNGSIIRATGIEQAHIPNVNPSDVDEGTPYISNVNVLYFYNDMKGSLAIIPTDAVIQTGTKTGHGDE